LEVKINSNNFKLDEVLKFLSNVISLKIKSAEGKNNNYKKNIIGMKFVEARDLADVLKSSVDLVILLLFSSHSTCQETLSMMNCLSSSPQE
jgi:hypothetical protein